MGTNILEEHTTSKTLVFIYSTGLHFLEVTVLIFSAVKTSYLTYIYVSYQFNVPLVALQDMTEHFIDYVPLCGVRLEVLMTVNVFWDVM
jgi:hypothetical protein